jgi:hypothetical protein
MLSGKLYGRKSVQNKELSSKFFSSEMVEKYEEIFTK